MIKNQYEIDAVAKSNYIFELLKQYISLKQVTKRNLHLQDPFNSHSDDYKKLPFFLIKFQPGSHINIYSAKDKSQLIIESSHGFDVMNENHLFHRMGLTRIESRSVLNQLLPVGLYDLLDKHDFIRALKQGSPTFRKEMSEESLTN